MLPGVPESEKQTKIIHIYYITKKEECQMENIQKAEAIIERFEFMLMHPVFRTAEEIIARCSNPAELDYWYRIVCLDDYCEEVII